MATGTFKDWLAGQLDTQAIPRRELARRLAAKYPDGATYANIESCRRQIYKYLDVDPVVPNDQTRAAFADAFGVDPSEIPADEEEEPSELAATLQALAREQAELSRRLNKALRTVSA